ncbi:unnamed protein product [Brassica oleracea var. botrytis]|uniref:(rape) hypothetical protein n=1 Tax=Brassica napus TaxID=3708 RepID=A0A816LU49_BRANA|nr:uncharacterized protein BNACNNG00580D [Brassica napus]KAH0867761.1 hypothetical protein HID58_074783 [Brassica napus]CAF1960064.1 unnamed protein product [Brassica napus]
MWESINLPISCNFSSFPHLKPSRKAQSLSQPRNLTLVQSRAPLPFLKPDRILLRNNNSQFLKHEKKGLFHVCRSSLNNPDPDKTEIQDEGRDWTSSVLLFALWGALLYYCFNLAPDQTPTQDLYFLKKLLNLKGDDGFRMNQILVGLWYIMGLWPVVYAMLLLPTGRSKTQAWPFVVFSFFGGVYALLPYFALWNPPSPPVSESELRQWPFNVLESKVTAGVTLVAGLGLILYALVGNAGDWKEFYQYFRESKFIHVTSLDFCLLSAFAPFWVYNDMTARKWFDKGRWLLPVSVVPFLGPSLYLLLRPALSETTAPTDSSASSSDPSQ